LAKQHKNHNNDQHRTEYADACVAIAIAIAAKATAESAEEKDDEHDNKDCAKRHDVFPSTTCHYAGERHGSGAMHLVFTGRVALLT
jgi:hypothetical protein